MKLTQEQRNEIVRMYEEGLKCHYIGALFGVRPEYASKLAIRYGKPLRRPNAQKVFDMKKPVHSRSCAICSKPFQTKHALTLTCSVECSDSLRQQRRRERHARGKARGPKLGVDFLEEAAEVSTAAWASLKGQS